jgi:ribosomal-protein-alanine N-acetyltransferase
MVSASGAHYDRAVTFFTDLSADVSLRLIEDDDADAIAEAYRRNRQHLAPWEPERSEAFFTASHQSSVVTTQLEHYAAGTGLPLVLVAEDEIVGRVNLSNIVRGAFQSASVGYWVDGAHTGRGLASAAIEALIAYSRDELALHRLEASVLPHNAASRRVLANTGFQSFGLAPSYLQIAGVWQDHLLTQRILY